MWAHFMEGTRQERVRNGSEGGCSYGQAAQRGGRSWDQLCQIQTSILRLNSPDPGCCRLLELLPAKQRSKEPHWLSWDLLWSKKKHSPCPGVSCSFLLTCIRMPCRPASLPAPVLDRIVPCHYAILTVAN